MVNDLLAIVELFLCQLLATCSVDHKLDALGRSRSSWRVSVPLTHTRMEAYFAECKHSSCSDIEEQEHLQLPGCNKQHEHFVWDDLCFCSIQANTSSAAR